MCGFISIRFYSFLDIFWSIFFFLSSCYIRGMHGKRGVICPLFGYVTVCVYYILFMHCICILSFPGLLIVMLNLYPQH